MSVTITNVNTQFVDIDLNFEPNPITGDVAQKLNQYAVNQSIINLIMTRPYETPYHPEISSQVNSLLFELDSPITQQNIKTSIIQVLTKFEPRIQIIDVTVTSVQNSSSDGYKITVSYTIIGSGQQYSVSTLLTRTR
jgi:phage baseplate assembly protein W